MKYKADMHVHSQYSYDSDMTISTIADICESKELDYVALTEHLSLDADVSLRLQRTKRESRHIDIISRTRNIDILKGFEISDPNLYPDMMSVFSAFSLDFIIGSVHSISRVDTESEEAVRQNYIDYYRSTLEMIKIGKFDALGHLGYIDKYYNYKLNDLELIRDILKLIIEKDIALEINSSAKRRIGRDTFPDYDTLKLYKDLGGLKVTLGSDAHEYKEIYDNMEVANDIAEEFQFEKGIYKKRKWTRL